MNATKIGSEALAVVIDVVASRERDDQVALLAGMQQQVVRWLVEDGSALSAGATTGDELQALYGRDDVGAALFDLARLRLSLLCGSPDDAQRNGGTEVRCGLGVGEVLAEGAEVQLPHATAPGQSGSAWWNARAAVDRLEERRNGWPVLRWWIVGDEDAPQLLAGMVALDTVLAGFGDEDAQAALALLDGQPASAVAELLGITASSLSRRLHGRGVYGLVRSLEMLGAA